MVTKVGTFVSFGKQNKKKVTKTKFKPLDLSVQDQLYTFGVVSPDNTLSPFMASALSSSSPG